MDSRLLMQKKLFQAAPIKNSSHNVIVNSEYYSTRYAYIDGYYEGAKILVDSALTRKQRDKEILFFPICFNYRHYLELHLKSLIELTDELYLKMQKLGYVKKNLLNTSSERSLDQEHSIGILFQYFEKRLKIVAQNSEIFDPNIRKYIMQFHSIDSDGQKFRYHITKKEQTNFSTTEKFDLKNIAELMEKIKDLLYGVDCWLEHYISMSDDMIDEMSSHAI